MSLDAKAFTAFEQTAHDRIAGAYAEHFAPLTSLALAPLLDAARLAPGRPLLDVATGPGIAAAAARQRGAVVTAVDVSPGMIAVARKAHPGVDFQVVEVAALPFQDASFDTVICNFALGHFPLPEAALAECVRVLAPRGTLAFSWWDHPVRQRVQGLFREVIAELGLSPPANVPQGHDTLRYSDSDAFADLLHHAGLQGVTVKPYQTTHLVSDVDALWNVGIGGMAVTASAVTAQAPAIQAKARDALARRVEAYRSARGLEIPVAFFIGTGAKG